MSFFKPHLDYCNIIWSCTSKTILNPIKISMNKAVRIMTFSKYDSHSEPLYKKLKLLNLSNTINYNLGKFLWDTTNNINIPVCILSIVKLKQLSRFNRHITQTKRFTPLFRTMYKANFITTTGPPLWNNIPNDIKSAMSKRLFAKKYLQYILDNN